MIQTGFSRRIFSRSFHSTPRVRNWAVSNEVRDKKSVFVARARHIKSAEEGKQLVEQLKRENKKIAKATHNITAYRIFNNGNVVQDSNDDGEAAAGGRVLKLLELMDCRNVIVCVTRWYGGVQLGSKRFKLISQCARQALVRGRFDSPPNSPQKVKK